MDFYTEEPIPEVPEGEYLLPEEEYEYEEYYYDGYADSYYGGYDDYYYSGYDDFYYSGYDYYSYSDYDYSYADYYYSGYDDYTYDYDTTSYYENINVYLLPEGQSPEEYTDLIKYEIYAQ